MVLELCRSEQITDTETIEMHLQRIKSLVSTWAAQVSFLKCDLRVWSTVMFIIQLKLKLLMCVFQPCFAEVEFPESNFVDQVELFLKDPEEKEKFFQVCELCLGVYGRHLCIIRNIFIATHAIKCYCSTLFQLKVVVIFQDVFPTDFGPEYDGALQMLMHDFLSRLEKLLPVPDTQQVL